MPIGIYKRKKGFRKTMSKIMKGNTNGFKKGNRINIGKSPSIKTRQKLSDAQKGEKGSNWQGGKSFEPYSVDWTQTLRRAIRERDNYICQVCSQYGHYVHHIDYDKKNCNPDNLITLCNKCHTKTNFNRKYWTKHFYESRKKFTRRNSYSRTR